MNFDNLMAFLFKIYSLECIKAKCIKSDDGFYFFKLFRVKFLEKNCLKRKRSFLLSEKLFHNTSNSNSFFFITTMTSGLSFYTIRPKLNKMNQFNSNTKIISNRFYFCLIYLVGEYCFMCIFKKRNPLFILFITQMLQTYHRGILFF
jgi:hypothetical protein